MRKILKFLISLILILFLLQSVLKNDVYSSQKSFFLDPENPIFRFEEYALNNTNSSENLIFSGIQNITRYITIPKNSTVIYSNITISGEITPSQTTGSSVAFQCVAVGNVTKGQKDDIVIGAAGEPHVSLYNSSLIKIADFNISSGIVNSVSIGEVNTSSPGKEIAVATSGNKIFLLNSTLKQIWNYTATTSGIKSVFIGNLSPDQGDEIVFGGNDLKVSVLNSSGHLKWDFDVSPTVVNSIAVGDVNGTYEGNEVVAGGTGNKLYIFDNIGNSIKNISIGDTINSIAIGEITSTPGNEIIIGTDNGTVHVLTNNGNIEWSYFIGTSVYSVAVGDTTSDLGNEIAVGSGDNKIYKLNSSGSFIWSHTTGNDVYGVAIGDVSIDSLNETVGVSIDQNVYVLNFNYYPTNVSIDIGGDGDYDWVYITTEKLRSQVVLDNSSISQGIKDYLESCIAINCNVPISFHSDASGKLNITNINITYNYNASEAISVQLLANTWSRTNNTMANSSIGYKVKNISYPSNPAKNITVKYVKINDSATSCDFWGKRYLTYSIEGSNYCDVTDYQILIGSLPRPQKLWDSTMDTEYQAFLITQPGIIDEYGFWKKNMTVSTFNDNEVLYNLTVNISLDENYVTSEERLLVEWYNNETYYDITPSTGSTNCQSSDPSYSVKKIGNDDFFVCKQDTNYNGVFDFFIWKQPHTSERKYIIQGASNYPLELSEKTINSSSTIWGSALNFSVMVKDAEGDNATISLWVYFSINNSWEKIETKNMTTNGTVSFSVLTDANWTGTNLYRYEYMDFNSTTGIPMHSPVNESSYMEFYIGKHNTEIIYAEGNNTAVNRTGTNSTNFVVRVKDISLGSYVGGNVNCTFWVTTNGSSFSIAGKSSTNSSGYCNISFDPNQSCVPMQQNWIAGVDNDAYYNSANSSSYIVNVYGTINVSFHESIINRNFTRGTNVNILAGLYDEFSNLAPAAGYTCVWYINNTQVSSSPTNSSGYCNYTWFTSCSNYLYNYPINLTLVGGAGNYYIINDRAGTKIRLKDSLTINIISPYDGEILYEQQNSSLNSSVVDSCGVPQENYSVNWYLEKSGDWRAIACQSPNLINTGDNTTFGLETEYGCSPRRQTIIANATGEFYQESKKNVTVDIYGWANANLTIPISGNVTNRTIGGVTSIDVVCIVKNNKTNLGVAGIAYPVVFYRGDTEIGRNTTNSTGYAKIKWNITSSPPQGNHTIKCAIQDNSSLYYKVLANESSAWVVIVDENETIPPAFISFHADSVEPQNNVTIEANITDWSGVSASWINLTYPNQSSAIYFLSNVTSNILTGKWQVKLINLTNIGRYDYRIYANDTRNYTNSTMGWFFVYPKIYFFGNATNRDQKNITLNFTFFEAGTNKTMYIPNSNYSGGSYNFSVFKTNMDINVQVLDHQLFIRNVNITASLIKNGNENATNITRPLLFDNVSISEILLQPTTKNKLLALAIENNLVFDNATITLNYTKNLNDYPGMSEPALSIYKCSNWNFENRTGCSGSWEKLTLTESQLDQANNLISADITNMSAFVVAEYCPTCPGGGSNNNNNPTVPSAGGGGGGTGGITATCGNNECEIGENVDNCPADCGKAERPPFTVKTNLTDVQIESGASELYAIWIKNTANQKLNVSVHFSGSAFHFISIERNFVELNIDEEKMLPIYVTIPTSTDPAVYTGEIVATGQGYTQRIPITITVPFPGTLYLDVVVEALTKKINQNETAVFHVLIYNLGFRKKVNITIDYLSKNLDTGEVIYYEREYKTLEASLPIIKNLHIPANASLAEYSYEVTIEFYGQKISSADTFQVVAPFWNTTKARIVLLIIILFSSILLGYYIRKLYKEWRASKVRYIFPVDIKALPKGELWVGKIAETNEKTTFEIDELRTHLIVAGATGSGKSVSAMVIVEELLEKKIPVVVFDPTAQWTGFVRPCKDENLLKFYPRFGMDTKDAKPYKGMIYEVTDPTIKIDFKKYMNPGEITIFTLNKLKPGEYDQAVENIVDTIFSQGWEESTKMQLAIVFDEVHRLLEKYGGKGGYVALEKACREFRKWGIGLIMVSQVLSDFKEAIKGNVMTEIQLHTKSLADLQRIEKKFGEEYAKRATKLEVGIGMVQNPKYNKGKPYFVSFRPTYHSPHKIPDEELQTYKEYEKMLEEIEEKIKKMASSGKDVFGLNVELKLAKDKLKKGRFRMAKIYIDSLTKSLNK